MGTQENESKMIIVDTKNVHSVLPCLVLHLFQCKGDKVVKRLEAMMPIGLVVHKPSECLTFWPEAKPEPFAELVDWLFVANRDEFFAYVPETHTAIIRRFDLGSESLSKISFLAELYRQRSNGAPRALTILIGQLSMGMPNAERLAPLINSVVNPWCPYNLGHAKPTPIITVPKLWDQELKMFLDEGDSATGYRNRFFRAVANPCLQALRHLTEDDKPKAYQSAAGAADRCSGPDWKLCSEQYLVRDFAAWKKKSS